MKECDIFRERVKTYSDPSYIFSTARIDVPGGNRADSAGWKQMLRESGGGERDMREWKRYKLH